MVCFEAHDVHSSSIHFSFMWAWLREAIHSKINARYIRTLLGEGVNLATAVTDLQLLTVI